MKIKLQSLKKQLSVKKGILLLFAIAWSWLLLVDVGRMADSVMVGYGALLIVYVFLVAVSTYIVTKAIGLGLFALKDKPWYYTLKITVCWAAVELFLAWLLAAIFWGSGSSWDDIIPFGSLTPLVMFTPVKFLTRFFGYFGTSASVGVGILLILQGRKWHKRAFVYWIVLFGLSLTSYMIFKTPNGPVVHTTIVSEKLAEPRQVNPGESVFVLLPEYGLDNYESPSVHKRFELTSDEVFFSGTRLITGNDGSRNVLVYGSNRQGYIEERTKSRLIVGGEFMPYLMELSLKHIAPVTYDQFKLRRVVNKGSGQLETFALPSGVVVGNAACSSIMNSEDYRRLARQGAVFLSNSASLEIFKGSRLFGMYHDGFAKFMAVANARPFLQSANNWKAFALDQNGNTLASVQPTGTKDVTIQPNSRKTPYTYLGEWVALTGGLYIAKDLIVLAKGRWKKIH